MKTIESFFERLSYGIIRGCGLVLKDRRFYSIISDLIMIAMFLLFLTKSIPFGETKTCVFLIALTSTIATLLYLTKILNGLKEDVDSMLCGAFLIIATIWTIAWLAY